MINTRNRRLPGRHRSGVENQVVTSADKPVGEIHTTPRILIYRTDRSGSAPRATPAAPTDKRRPFKTGSPPLSRPVKTVRHCPRRRPRTLRSSRTYGPDADQSQHGRLRIRKDRRSALVAQGIEHRFPKPCVAGSNPAGGTTTHQAKVGLTSTNIHQSGSCCLPASAAVRPHLPPFAKPLRNRKALEANSQAF